MTAVATKASGESAVLLPPREAPYLLRDVYELIQDDCRSELVLQWSEGYLVLRADEDTDSLCFRFQPGDLDLATCNQTRAAAAKPWNSLLGKECGWTWVAVNQQGYCDSVLLSFDGIAPTVLLHVVASSIEVFSITRS
jgi:hypothetical protein